MATCPYTQGYDDAADCLKFPGGCKMIAFVESYNKGTSFVQSAGVVTTMALAATKVFRVYKVRKNKSFVSDKPTVTDVGGKSYKPTITMFLADMSTALRQEVDLLLSNQAVIAWMDNSNVWRLAGYYGYMNVIGEQDANFGTVMGDGQTQTIVFTGEETKPMFEINTATAISLGLPLL